MSPAGQPDAIVGTTDRLEIFVSEGSGRPTSKLAKELECVCGSAKFEVLARVRYERTQVLLGGVDDELDEDVVVDSEDDEDGVEAGSFSAFIPFLRDSEG